MTTMTGYPATPKQVDFVEKLIREKDLTGTMYEGWTPDWSSPKATSKTTSAVIDFLLTLPTKAQEYSPSFGGVVEAGVYEHEGELFRVYLGQNAGRMLVKKIVFSSYDPHPLDSDEMFENWNDFGGEIAAAQMDARLKTDVEYEYVGAASRVMNEDWKRLSLDQVGKLGISSGHCLICGRRLDDPESVDRGIGPVCASNY
jgi:hypothetical protein